MAADPKSAFNMTEGLGKLLKSPWVRGIGGGIGSLWMLDLIWGRLMEMMGRDPESLNRRMQSEARRQDMLSNAMLLSDEASQRRDASAERASTLSRLSAMQETGAQQTALGQLLGLGMQAGNGPSELADLSFARLLQQPPTTMPDTDDPQLRAMLMDGFLG